MKKKYVRDTATFRGSVYKYTDVYRQLPLPISSVLLQEGLETRYSAANGTATRKKVRLSTSAASPSAVDQSRCTAEVKVGVKGKRPSVSFRRFASRERKKKRREKREKPKRNGQVEVDNKRTEKGRGKHRAGALIRMIHLRSARR